LGAACGHLSILAAMTVEPDAAMVAAVTKLSERMKLVLETMLPEEEAARATTDQCFSRWMRANDCDVDAASKGMMNYVHWYMEKPQYGVPEGVMAVAQGQGADLVPNEVASKKAFVVPDVKDADGRPIVLITVRKHDPDAEGYDIEQLTLFAAHLIESTIAAMVAPVDTLCCVFDLRDIGYKNVDMKAVKRMLFLLTRMYPERLGRCYLLDAPTLFSVSWSAISMMLKETTTRKIKFVDQAGLSEIMGADSVVMKLVQESREDTETPAEADATEKPAEAEATEIPAEADAAEKPAEADAAEKPAGADAAEKTPNGNGYAIEKPAEEAVAQQLEADATKKPADAVTEKAPEADATEKAVEADAIEK